MIIGENVKSGKILYFFIQLVRFFAVVIVGYLFFLSLFSTSLSGLGKRFLDDGAIELYDKRYFLPDNALMHIVCIFFFMGIYYFFRRKISSVAEKVWKNRFALYALYFGAGIIYIYTAQMYPNSDPGKVISVAYSILSGDVSSYTEFDGYMFRYPFQNGVVLLNAILIKAFGPYAFEVYQLLNLIANIFFVEFLGRISQKMWKNECGVGCCILLLFFLFPVPFLFITYNYGNGISLALITIAFYIELAYFEKRSILLALTSSTIAGLACVIKSNSRIFVVAMIICLIFESVRNKKILNNVVFACFLILCRLIMVGAVNTTIESITGVDTPEGMPSINWVAMGISDPGTYNGLSVDLFKEANYDAEVSKELAIESIRNRIKMLYGDKSEALKWLGRKISLNWNDPTFDALAINKSRDTKYCVDFYKSFFNGRYARILEAYLNHFCTFILFGALICLCLEKKFDYRNIILIICVIGGFIFHIFWEGSSHYTLPYFLLLLPYTANGLRVFVDSLLAKGNEIKIIIVLFALGLLLFLGKNFKVLEYTIFVTDTPEEISEYYENIS